MNVSESFFGRYARLSPFVIVDEQVYQVSDELDGINNLTAAGAKFGLHASGTLAQLESIESRRANFFFDFKRDFIQKAVEREIRSREQIGDTEALQHTVKFVLGDVLPLMIDTARDLGELLKVDVSDKRTGRQIIDDIILQETEATKRGNGFNVAEIKRAIAARTEALEEKLLRNPSRHAQPESELGKVIDNNPVWVTWPNTFPLKERGATNQDDSFTFTVNGKTYVPSGVLNTLKIEQHYSKVRQERLKREAITELETQIEQTIAARGTTNGAIERIAQRKEFSYGNLGYFVDDGACLVYWEMPKFAMQNPLRPTVYHPFPATKIAVIVNSSRGQIFHDGGSYVLGAMVHPFLRDWKSPKEHICILSHRDYGNTAPDVVNHISTAINAFTNGLTMASLRDHGALTEDAGYFGRPLRESLSKAGEMGRQEAVDEGYVIRNEWNIDGKLITENGNED